MAKERRRRLLACLATAALLGPIGWMWQASLVPDTYSVMNMGYLDYGGGPQSAAHAKPEGQGAPGTGVGTSVADLVEKGDRAPDVRVRLVARQERFTLASGQAIDGYTLNGSSPGPTITVRQGELLEVRIRNESVSEGMTLHWHGVDVPNAEDGVAGVTQDAIGEGESYVYRFVAEDAGTYWYHSHQFSNRQVIRGLLGPLIVRPGTEVPHASGVDVTAVAHTYGGIRTLNGRSNGLRVTADYGESARVRVVNTDNAPTQVWADVPFRVLAIDGTDLNGPTGVENQRLVLTAGGRADLEVVVPRNEPARVQIGGATAVVVGPAGAGSPEPPPQPAQELDLLSYGSLAPLGFDPDKPDRRFDYIVDRRPGFKDGIPGLWWTVNGHQFPDVPMFVVREGDVVRMTIENRTAEVHPMHLHGHHAVVLSRDGTRATGSPWWVDSLDVKAGERFEVALVADNPGVWMVHCHNLNHAKEGLVAHFMYEGVTTPYMVGGDAGNEPE